MYYLKVATRTRPQNSLLRWTALAVAMLYLCPPAALGQCSYKSAPKKFPPEVKLVISTEKIAVRISEPLRLHVELSNRSNAPISIVDRLVPEVDFELHLFNTKGIEAPLTEFARKMRFGLRHYSTTGVVLAPGDKYAVDEDLATTYAISERGQYVLDACRDVVGIGNLYSNKLVITFTR